MCTCTVPPKATADTIIETRLVQLVQLFPPIASSENPKPRRWLLILFRYQMESEKKDDGSLGNTDDGDTDSWKKINYVAGDTSSQTEITLSGITRSWLTIKIYRARFGNRKWHQPLANLQSRRWCTYVIQFCFLLPLIKASSYDLRKRMQQRQQPSMQRLQQGQQPSMQRLHHGQQLSMQRLHTGSSCRCNGCTRAAAVDATAAGWRRQKLLQLQMLPRLQRYWREKQLYEL